ncbi:efflux RND transporter periplasmic adaptor subunit [Cupriavidus numazuensis]|nr:efflux RND transporter periplasmic adaptor subunit [Cupriavidus numazuensis]
MRRPAQDMHTVQVARATIESSVTALGTLQPRRYVDVGAQVSGQIFRLLVQPGDVVKEGQLLVEIDPSVQQATVDAGRASLAALRAQLADQRAQHRLAGQQHARQRRMAADEATREEDVQGAEAALASAAARIDHIQAQIAQTQATLKADEARLGYTRIYAPMAGTVVSVDARQGQTLNATYQTPNVLRIADLGTMTVWSEVSEADVRRVRPGMPVYFTTLGGETRRWQGKVRQVLPAPPTPADKTGSEGAATPASAASKVIVYTALFDVENADGELMPQMTAQVSFIEASARDVVTVPLASLTANGERGHFTARVLRADGEVETRRVKVGVRNRFSAQVLEGLQPGERVVADSATERES